MPCVCKDRAGESMEEAREKGVCLLEVILKISTLNLEGKLWCIKVREEIDLHFFFIACVCACM